MPELPILTPFDKAVSLAALRLIVTESVDKGEPISGATAAACAVLFHHVNVVPGGQWGGAYLSCPECGAARDISEADEVGDLLSGRDFECYGLEEDAHECDTLLWLGDLRISEGWVERDALRQIDAA